MHLASRHLNGDTAAQIKGLANILENESLMQRVDV